MLIRTRNAFAAVLRALGSLLPRQSGGTDRSGRAPAAPEIRVVRPWREDAAHSYPTVGLTPSRALAFIQQADGGAPLMQYELFAEMLQKWPRLAAVEQTRRLALTGLDWELVPAPPGATARLSLNRARRATTLSAFRSRLPRESLTRSADAASAPHVAARRSDDPGFRSDAVLDFCRDALSSIDRFRDALDHLASAIGFGIAVAELVWERGRLIDLVPVPYSRLVADPNEPWRIRVRTEEEPSLGVALDAQPSKWIVHRPRAVAGRPFDGGLLRASLLLYVAQNLSFKDWLIFSQVAGMPVRVAQFEPGTPEADKAELLSMLEALGTDAVAIFSKNIDLKFVESQRSASDRPFEPLQRYCNTEITILWLGQHLTTDLTGQGSRAAAEVHDRVREDLLVHDIAAEGQTLRRDLLTPIVRARFGDGTAVPQFRRALAESSDARTLAETIGTAVNDLGLRVPRRWAHRALGIPEPSAGEPILSASEQGGREPARARRATVRVESASLRAASASGRTGNDLRRAGSAGARSVAGGADTAVPQEHSASGAADTAVSQLDVTEIQDSKPEFQNQPE